MIEAPPYPDALVPFFDRGLITGEPLVLKSGKEGTVYRCAAHPGTGARFFAAKVYRPRHHRSFHNDAVYMEGRLVPDKRLQRAVAGKTRIGREVQFSSWVDHEFTMLKRLHGAGADVPRPIDHSESAILMEYIGDEESAAPPLKSVRLAPEEVRPLLLRALDNVELWLGNGFVHGDLSAYNILYWKGRITAIDFPQAVNVRRNPNARSILARDVSNVYAYWARYGIHVDPSLYIDDLWWRAVDAPS